MEGKILSIDQTFPISTCMFAHFFKIFYLNSFLYKVSKGVSINYGRGGTNKSAGGITKFKYPFMGGGSPNFRYPLWGGSPNQISKDLKIGI